MPVVKSTSYTSPTFLINGHFETIYPAVFRKIKNLPDFTKKRITTPDGDFLDLDLYLQGSDKLLIVQHGLEGNSQRAYMTGMAKVFFDHGVDVCLWNFRGCSGELNDQPIFYNSGATYDLRTVVENLEQDYDKVFLSGFSLGGNLTLKFLGEASHSEKIKKAIVFSVPVDLDSASDNLMTRKCWVYEKRFLTNLKAKVLEKEKKLPGYFDTGALSKVRTLRDFDEYVTAPLHGFSSASDYYARCSARFFLKGISIPTVIVNAENDPLLTPECLDPLLTKELPNVTMELTPRGGHVGFVDFKSEYYWSERRAVEFILNGT